MFTYFKACWLTGWLLDVGTHMNNTAAMKNSKNSSMCYKNRDRGNKKRMKQGSNKF